MGDVHDVSGKLESTIQKLEDSNFGSRNKELLTEFQYHLKAEGLSKHRICRYLSSFSTLEPHIDFDLDKAEKKDLVELVGKINQNELGKDYSPWTKCEFRKAVKRFYKWEKGEECELIDFITTKPKKKELNKVDPDQLPTPNTVVELREHMQNPRDKALITVLWESGARIGELLNMNWEDITRKDELWKVELTGKTGTRRVPIKSSCEYLTRWESFHPNPDPEQPVFTNLQSHERVAYRAVKGGIDRATEYAGIDLKTNPHAFRKSRATFLASRGFNVYQLMAYFGWETPETALTYVRLAQSDVEDAFLQVYKQSNLEEFESSENGAELTSEKAQVKPELFV